MNLAERYMVSMMITSWQISHINYLETLSDRINNQISSCLWFISTLQSRTDSMGATFDFCNSKLKMSLNQTVKKRNNLKFISLLFSLHFTHPQIKTRLQLQSTTFGQKKQQAGRPTRCSSGTVSAGLGQQYGSGPVSGWPYE